MAGLADGGGVFARGSEEGVKEALILAAQGAAKVGESSLLVEDDLVGGYDCAAHSYQPISPLTQSELDPSPSS